MAIITFDYFNQPEIPSIYLANPDETFLFNLGTIYNRNFELRYNTLSKFTFSADSTINGEPVDYYDWLKFRRVVIVEGIGKFVITDIQIENNGIVETKTVTCDSYEKTLANKNITIFKGNYFFYCDPSVSPTYSLLHKILEYIPGWSIGTVSPALTTSTTSAGISRYFDVITKTLYDFMMNEVSQTYQCVFVFDTINKIISAYTIEEATSDTDIFISFDNLLESVKISESTDEIVTALTVLGGENLSINQVNPLGTDVIYEFGYYKNTDWMTQDLIDALTAWEIKTAGYQQEYADTLTELLQVKNTYYTATSDLATINGQLAAENSVRDARIAGGQSTSDIDAIIASLTAQKTAIETNILSIEQSIRDITSILTGINSGLSFQNNFTESQYATLSSFIIGNTYTNTNFIQTSETTLEQEQQQAQMLYNQARGIWNPSTNKYDGGVLNKLSQPRYTFEITSANFMFLKEYQPFVEQIALGKTITIEVKKDNYVKAVLLGINFNYDDPNSFSMLLSNRLRLDTEDFQYTDIFDSMEDTTTSTAYNAQKWNNTSDAIGTASKEGKVIVTSFGYSSPSNICLFGNSTGNEVFDNNAMYLPPTEYIPALVCGNSTYTYSTRGGIYSIIGRTCTFSASLVISGRSGTGSNQVFLTIPAVSSSLVNTQYALSVHPSLVTLDTGYTGVTALVPSSGSLAALYEIGSGRSSNMLAGSAIGSSNAVISITGTYIIK